MESKQNESDVELQLETKAKTMNERIKHNRLERERRLAINKEIESLKTCLPNIKHKGKQQISRLTIVRKATSFIIETRKSNKKLRAGNSSLKNENRKIEQEIQVLVEQQRKEAKQMKAECETLKSTNGDQNSCIFYDEDITNFQEKIADFLIEEIFNSSYNTSSFNEEMNTHKD